LACLKLPQFGASPRRLDDECGQRFRLAIWHAPERERHGFPRALEICSTKQAKRAGEFGWPGYEIAVAYLQRSGACLDASKSRMTDSGLLSPEIKNFAIDRDPFTAAPGNDAL